MQHVASSLLGLGNGGTYAALALALVLIYRASGVINFATGAQALLTAYVYAFLRRGELLILVPGLDKTLELPVELGPAPALVVAVGIAAGLGSFLYVAVFRPLRDAPPLARAVASLGVLVILQTLMSNRVGSAPVSVEAIYPSERWTFSGMAVLSDRIYLASTVMVLGVVVTVAYRWTRFGLLTRATAESQVGALVSGISPTRVGLVNWAIAGAVAGLAGVLIAPLAPVTPNTYTLFIVPALAAAIVGGFSSAVPAVAAGIGVGMIQSWLVYLSGRHDWLPSSGLGETVPLVVMLVALLVTGRAVPVRGALLKAPLGRAPQPRSLLRGTLLGLPLGCLALATTHGSARAAVITTMIMGMLALSLVVVTGYAGQVSLAQLSLAGVGAFTLSGLTAGWGVPFPIAPLLAAVITTVVGVVIGLPALRLRGLTLGVVTLALAFGLEAIWFRNSDIVASSGATVESPSLFGIDLGVGIGHDFPRLGFGLVCLAAVVAVAVGVARLRTSALGSAMLAVRANERSAAGIGIDVVRVKVISFAIGSFIAGLAGSLFAYRRGVVTWESFTALGGLSLISTAYLAGVTSVTGGLLAGVLATGGVAFFAGEEWIDLGSWFPLLSGAAVVVTLMQHPEGLATLGHRVADRVDGLIASRRPTARPSRRRSEEPRPHRTDPGPASDELRVDGLTVTYGGVVAVDDLSFTVAAGRIVGLIGPNGAGKTSAIDAVTGFARSSGAVVLNGTPVDGLSAHRRVRQGLCRTFQALELYEDLTVAENVAAAAFGQRHDRYATAADALAAVGLDGVADHEAGSLSQGHRQLLSVARALATRPKILLLDEPAAGLDTAETAQLGDRLRALAATGIGILLVDHDVNLVLDVCDQVYVLNFGERIADGPPGAIRSDPAVAVAYLGDLHARAVAE